eukprot:2879241-Rhodomonas_salina.1
MDAAVREQEQEIAGDCRELALTGVIDDDNLELDTEPNLDELSEAAELAHQKYGKAMSRVVAQRARMLKCAMPQQQMKADLNELEHVLEHARADKHKADKAVRTVRTAEKHITRLEWKHALTEIAPAASSI